MSVLQRFESPIRKGLIFACGLNIEPLFKKYLLLKIIKHNVSRAFSLTQLFQVLPHPFYPPEFLLFMFKKIQHITKIQSKIIF